jgi:antitoxin component YwqK of YwqJK toxin-antitoxin module
MSLFDRRVLWNYEKGKREGTFKTYYKSGQIMSEIDFKDNKINGMMKKYYKDGMYKAIDVYENGKLTRRSEYDESGALAFDKEY